MMTARIEPRVRASARCVAIRSGRLVPGGVGRRLGAAHAGKSVDHGRPEDRQPGPGHQRGTDVVPADVGVDIRGGEEAGDRRGRPGQERVAGPADRGHDERDRDQRGQDPVLRHRAVDELAELAWQLAKWVEQAALELLGEDDVAEAVPRVRRAVHEVRPERPGAQGQLEIDEDDGPNEQADARQDEPAASPDPRVDGEHVQPDRDHQQQGQRMVADGQPEDDRRGKQVAVAPVAWDGVGRADPPVPLDQEPEQDRHERQVKGVRLGVGGDRPGDRGQGHRDAGRDPDRQPTGKSPHEVDREAGRHGQAQAGQQVHPKGRLAERLEDDRRQPAEEDVGREAGRVRGAQQRRDGLQLAGVPVRDAGQHRQHRGHEGDERDDRGGQPASVHHPGDRLQMTPQGSIEGDATTGLMARSMPHLRRTAGRSNPSATRKVARRVRRATLCYAPIHLPRSCRSRSR